MIGNVKPCSGLGYAWEMEDASSGWFYAPDYYPSGEQIFQTGAASNSGVYSDTTNDANIRATELGDAGLSTYENYLAKQLPVVWEPEAACARRDRKTWRARHHSTRS